MYISMLIYLMRLLNRRMGILVLIIVDFLIKFVLKIRYRIIIIFILVIFS